MTQPVGWHSFYHPTEGGRLSRPRHCSRGAQPVPKAVNRSGCRDKHSRPQCDSNLDPLTRQSDVLTTWLHVYTSWQTIIVRNNSLLDSMYTVIEQCDDSYTGIDGWPGLTCYVWFPPCSIKRNNQPLYQLNITQYGTFTTSDLQRVTHTHTRLTALCPGLPGWANTWKVKPIWILTKQETVSCSGISWAIYKSAPRSRQITTPAPHHSSFLQARCPSCRPTNNVKALKAKLAKG